jgi:hypothetical protein
MSTGTAKPLAKQKPSAERVTITRIPDCGSRRGRGWRYLVRQFLPCLASRTHWLANPRHGCFHAPDHLRLICVAPTPPDQAGGCCHSSGKAHRSGPCHGWRRPRLRAVDPAGAWGLAIPTVAGSPPPRRRKSIVLISWAAWHRWQILGHFFERIPVELGGPDFCPEHRYQIAITIQHIHNLPNTQRNGPISARKIGSSECA